MLAFEGGDIGRIFGSLRGEACGPGPLADLNTVTEAFHYSHHVEPIEVNLKFLTAVTKPRSLIH